MKAYIFKSARAKRILERWAFKGITIKHIQGKTCNVIGQGQDTITPVVEIEDPYNAGEFLIIPLEACNLIEEEGEVVAETETPTIPTHEHEYFYSESEKSLRRYKKGEQQGEVSLTKPYNSWTRSCVSYKEAINLVKSNHYQQITEKEAKRLFPDSFPTT